MTKNFEILIIYWSLLVGTTYVPVFILRRFPRAKEFGITKVHKVIHLLVSCAALVIFLPQWPELLRRTIVEYQYRFEGGPDPETIFHDAENKRIKLEKCLKNPSASRRRRC